MEQIRIVVADDESHITHVVEMKLRSAGFDVRVASDGEEALDVIEAFKPHLVMTDFQMPVMSGFELAVTLKERGVDVPVLMVTARGHMLSEDDLARTNIKALLSKPFGPRLLVDRINDVLHEAGISAPREAAA